MKQNQNRLNFKIVLWVPSKVLTEHANSFAMNTAQNVSQSVFFCRSEDRASAVSVSGTLVSTVRHKAGYQHGRTQKATNIVNYRTNCTAWRMKKNCQFKRFSHMCPCRCQIMINWAQKNIVLPFINVHKRFAMFHLEHRIKQKQQKLWRIAKTKREKFNRQTSRLTRTEYLKPSDGYKNTTVIARTSRQNQQIWIEWHSIHKSCQHQKPAVSK